MRFLIRSIFFWIRVFLLLTILINLSILFIHFTFIFTWFWIYFIWRWIYLKICFYRCLITWNGTWWILIRLIRIFFTLIALIFVFVFWLFNIFSWLHIPSYFIEKWTPSNNMAFLITSVAFNIERTIIVWINT
jgi:hypothetical protein